MHSKATRVSAQDTKYELKLLNTYCLKILHLIEVTKGILNTDKTAKTQNLLLQGAV